MSEQKVTDVLDGKVLCTADGQPLPITGIDLVERKDAQTGGMRQLLQLTAEAGGYLINPQNPAMGAQPLDSPLAVIIEYDALGRDQRIALKILSQSLGLGAGEEIEDDGGDWLERFDEDSPKSVIPRMRNQGIYVSAKLKPDPDKAAKYGESRYFFNPAVMAKREPVSKTNLAAFRAKVKAKNGANADSPFNE